MGKLRVGTAKVCISPPAEMFPFPAPAYMGEGLQIDGIYMDMYVRMLAIDNGTKTFLFGVFEESNGTDALKEAVTEKYGIPYENQMFCHIHNHGGVQTRTVTKGGPTHIHHKYNENQVKYGEIIFEKALEAAGIALSGMKDACFGFGTGRSYINVNRDFPCEDGYWAENANYDGPSDKTLAVLKFTDAEGNLIAALLNYGCHAITTIGARDTDGKLKVSADFPGFTCDYLEKKYPGAVVMWTSGAAGDQNAIICYKGDKHFTEASINSAYDHLPDGLQYSYAQWIGERHAYDADQILKKTSASWSSAAMNSAYTDVFIPQQKAPENTNFWLNISLSQNNVAVVEKIAPEMVEDGRIVGRNIEDYVPTGTSEACETQMFVIGDTAIITAAAELYARLGMHVKSASPLRKVMLITNCGGHGNRVGYIQDTDSNTHKTFQHFGEAYPCDSNKIFTDGVKELTKEVFGER